MLDTSEDVTCYQLQLTECSDLLEGGIKPGEARGSTNTYAAEEEEVEEKEEEEKQSRNMWRSLSAALFVSVFLLPAVSQSHSALPEDLEGSGYDLDGSGSGSGDGWEQDEVKNVNSYGNKTLTGNRRGGNKNTLTGSSGETSDSTRWPATDDESAFTITFGSTRQFWESEEITAGFIAGGIAGAVIAIAVSAVLIHKKQKKGKEGHILGRRRASDEDYRKPIRHVVIV